MSELHANNRRIWTAALRSGKFPQTREKLGDPVNGMCCLGVGCYVLGIPFKAEDAFPPKAFVDAVGLGIVDEAEINGEYDGGSLVHLNDVDRHPFPIIADVIDNNPSLWVESDFQEARIQAAEEEAAEWDRLDTMLPPITPAGDEDDGA